MINQLIFFSFLLFSFSLLSACSVFTANNLQEDDVSKEEYYHGEESYGEDSDAISEKSDDVQKEDSTEASDDYVDDDGYVDDDNGYADDDNGYADDDNGYADYDGGEEERKEEYATEDSFRAGMEGDDAVSSFVSEVKTIKPAPVKKWISYRKIKNQPYRKAGFLVNTVYIARSGDDIQSVSNKIFGSDQTNQLYVINPRLKAREVKVGDKIYYQSPRRSEDSSQLLFYFEDQGIEPVYHQVQRGENIRTVASRLLGHANSWKEIWATNPELVSKLKVNQARTIKYWSVEAMKQSPAPASLATAEENTDFSMEENNIGSLEEEGSAEGKLEKGELEEEGSPLESSEGADIQGEENNIPPLEGGSSVEEIEGAAGNTTSKYVVTVVIVIGIVLICSVLFFSFKRRNRNFDYTYTSVENLREDE